MENNNENLQSNNQLDNNMSSSPLNTRGRKKSLKRSHKVSSSVAPMGAPLNDASRANRPTRIPIGTQRRLSVPERKGFVRRWVNDIEDRILMFEQAGYTKVIDDSMPIGDQCSKDSQPLSATRCKSVGRGRRAYLMEIPEDLYREDQLNKIKRNTENLQRAIRPKDIEANRYGEINIEDAYKQR